MQTQLFDAWPAKYTAWFSTPIGQLIKDYEESLLLQMLDPQPGEVIADIGCGSGIFTLPLIAQGAQVTGVDLSLSMLATAKDCLPAARFSATAGNILALPFADDRFDKVVSITALEFVEDAETAIAELFRITKPGGLVVVATLNSLSPWAERRKQAAMADPQSLFNHAYFRSGSDLQQLAGFAGTVKTAIHFAKDAEPQIAEQQEVEGQRQALDTGAFVIGAWRKPRE